MELMQVLCKFLAGGSPVRASRMACLMSRMYAPYRPAVKEISHKRNPRDRTTCTSRVFTENHAGNKIR